MSSGAPSPAANVSHVLETATQLFRVTLLKCLPLAMVVLLCAEVPNLYWIVSGHPLEHGWPQDSTYWVLEIISDAVALYIASAVMLQQRSLASGVRLSTVTALHMAVRRLPFLLLTWVLAQLSLVVGLTLLIVPGIFLFVCYLVMLPVVLFEQSNPYIALLRCVLLVRPYWWKTLAALVIAILVVLVFVLAFGAILGILSALLSGPAFQAIATACSIAFLAMVGVFFSALVLTLHSAAASSSA
jgi:hypothetical protein